MLEPMFPKRALEFFKVVVCRSGTYLEYGSGGSTVYAASIGVPNIIAIDSNREWLGQVETDIAGTKSKVSLLYCDVGPVGAYGRPVGGTHQHNFPVYSLLPWVTAQEQGVSPDLVLVDGRFRVACFLQSLLMAKPGTMILFDDYVNRQHYHVVEKFGKPQSRHGRMAAFRVQDSRPMESIRVLWEEYSRNPD